MDSELRKRFNPDGSLLRRQQLRMLELLEVIDVICRKHQIPYWLSSGTSNKVQHVTKVSFPGMMIWT